MIGIDICKSLKQKSFIIIVEIKLLIEYFCIFVKHKKSTVRIIICITT